MQTDAELRQAVRRRQRSHVGFGFVFATMFMLEDALSSEVRMWIFVLSLAALGLLLLVGFVRTLGQETSRADRRALQQRADDEIGPRRAALFALAGVAAGGVVGWVGGWLLGAPGDWWVVLGIGVGVVFATALSTRLGRYRTDGQAPSRRASAPPPRNEPTTEERWTQATGGR